jgi:hypothetical protein
MELITSRDIVIRDVIIVSVLATHKISGPFILFIDLGEELYPGRVKGGDFLEYHFVEIPQADSEYLERFKNEELHLIDGIYELSGECHAFVWDKVEIVDDFIVSEYL